ncbi:MAG: cytochrome c biogenesis protein ResB [Oscillospiraceae bacterium]|nr:cytochrome c biogenesis protein ResB [Oscillospiraceae bacterium]
MKKIWKFLGSMQFAIILLVILAAACAGGSFIPQGLSPEQYAAQYSERVAGLIVGLRLDDVFHAWWFLVLTAFLCGNLLLCNLIRLPQLIRRTRAAADPGKLGTPSVHAEGVRDFNALLAKLRMPKAVEGSDGEGRPVRYSVQNRIGLWGAWVCHLGILLLILGFTLGQMTKEEYTVYGVPGETKRIAEQDYAVRINDFRVDRQENGFVQQYTSDLTILELSGGEQAAAIDTQASVNHPGSAFGFKIYQNAMGDAAKLSVRKDGETLQESYLCVGDALQIMGTPLYLQLQSILPDYETGADGHTRSGFAYLIYVGDEFYTMSVRAEGEQIADFKPYEVFFSEPCSYTLLQIKRDRFTPLALVGGVVTLLGLLLAFYLQTRKLWARREEDGTWTVFGSSPKGGALFADRVKDAVEQLKNQS